MMDTMLNNEPRDIGARRERALRNRRIALFSLLALAGGVIGFTFALVEDGASAEPLSGTIPRGLAILFAIATALAMTVGCWLYKRSSDEVDLQHNLYASAYGAIALMVAYPVWFILWKGGIAPEPSHIALFLGLYAVTTVSYLYRKFR